MTDPRDNYPETREEKIAADYFTMEKYTPEENKRPYWWPECPYPGSVFPMTTEEYMRAIPDHKLRTAISGYLARFGWEKAEEAIWRKIKEEGYFQAAAEITRRHAEKLKNEEID